MFPEVIVSPGMRLARNQLPPLQPLLLHCHCLTLFPNPPGAVGLLTHPKIHLCSISFPQPEHPNTFPSATAGAGAAGAALLAAQSHPNPKHCQETSSRKSNLLRKTCLPLSTTLFTDAGSRHASGKMSAMVPVSEALPRLLSGAAAPLGLLMAPAVSWGVTSQGVTCDQGTCCSRGANPGSQGHHPGISHWGWCGCSRGHFPAASSHPKPSGDPRTPPSTVPLLATAAICLSGFCWEEGGRGSES